MWEIMIITEPRLKRTPKSCIITINHMICPPLPEYIYIQSPLVEMMSCLIWCYHFILRMVVISPSLSKPGEKKANPMQPWNDWWITTNSSMSGEPNKISSEAWGYMSGRSPSMNINSTWLTHKQSRCSNNWYKHLMILRAMNNDTLPWLITVSPTYETHCTLSLAKGEVGILDYYIQDGLIDFSGDII